LADARVLGGIVGLDMDGGFDALCRLYYRTAVALALGLAQILAHMAAHGAPPPEALHAAGGHAKSPLLVELYADATGVPVVVPRAPDGVLLGTAMAAAAAAGLHGDLGAAARAMHQGGSARAPDAAAGARFARDRAVLAAMQRQRAEIGALSGG
jgi:ribulose kinase